MGKGCSTVTESIHFSSHWRLFTLMLVVFLVITVLPLHGWTRTEVATVIPVQQEQVVPCTGGVGPSSPTTPSVTPGRCGLEARSCRRVGTASRQRSSTWGWGCRAELLSCKDVPARNPHMGSCMGESCARNRLKPLCSASFSPASSSLKPGG